MNNETEIKTLTEEANEILANYANFMDYEDGIDTENTEMLLENAMNIISRLVKFINK